MEGWVIQADMEEVSLPDSPSGTHPPSAIVPLALLYATDPPPVTHTHA
jgi:hypothetical protein